MTDVRILGIAMVRDEDVWVERAVRNVLDAVDEMILADHESRDRTPDILQGIAAELPHKVAYHRIKRGGDANRLLRDYVGERVWVLGVDGDELYEPDRLAVMRERLLAGTYDDSWLVKGNVLHCTELDEERGRATGYTTPPSRSVTKLFNFAALDSWTGETVEHFYGGRQVFRPGYSSETIRYLYQDEPWDESPFRCLHVCFSRRSSLQPERLVARRSLNEDAADTRLVRLRARLQNALGREPNSWWKLEKYRQGEPVTVDVTAFLRPRHD